MSGDARVEKEVVYKIGNAGLRGRRRTLGITDMRMSQEDRDSLPKKRRMESEGRVKRGFAE